MKKIISTITFLMICLISFGQTDSENKEEVFEMYDVSRVAEFIDGGEEGLMNFIAANTQYPKEAQKDSISGVVFLVFVVDTTGQVTDVQTMNKKIGYGLEEEAIRVLKLTSGMWIPAKQRDNLVSIRLRIPLRFQL